MEQDDTPLVFITQKPPRIPTKQDPSLAASASVMNVSPLRRERPGLKDLLASLTTRYPFPSLLSYIAALSTCSADDSPFYSLGGGDGSARRLGTVCALGRRA